ncbi:DNA-binding protein REB1 [Auxenochlorella protothecoides]|uniref:DNA-binding protein REB1 n=1 Tax=Auxenochlorella protothecoides TaxID=3075 RepID=A0A087SNN5_AUXPR|nr:DNA-binding protein REB1 [Auxenochlorella protothecoides]KFM27339.1 DNA-binding protein REB1 [Auxenochlorella protothecoides]
METSSQAGSPSEPPKKRRKGTPVRVVDKEAVPSPASVPKAAGTQPLREETPSQGVSVMPLAEVPGDAALKWRDSVRRRDVKAGPFTQAEKDTIRQALAKWAGEHGHSQTDFDWVFNPQASRSGLWKAVGAYLPHRTIKAGRWTKEEDAKLLAFVEEHGKSWVKAEAALGRMAVSCRDRWREIRLGSDKKSGPWSADEIARLRKAIADYEEARQSTESAASAQKLSYSHDSNGGADSPADEEEGVGAGLGSRRIILDDIDWGIISDQVGTRSNIQCLDKWYRQLSPSMVTRGEWGTGDDRRLMKSLWLSGACKEWEVDWGALVKGRSATQAKRRWRLMARVIPEHREKDFWEQVDWLVDTYLPALKEGDLRTPGSATKTAAA